MDQGTTKRHGSGRPQVRTEAASAIHMARVRQGLSQVELGVMMSYSLSSGQTVVSRLEAGLGTVEQAINAAGALGLAWDAVIEWVRIEREDG